MPISSEPPRVDIVLLRRETTEWTAAQQAMLPDGVRDTNAHSILLEFKYSESLSREAIVQALAYEHFFRTTRGLQPTEVRMFILCAKTPLPERLAAFGYAPTAQPGVYQSQNVLATEIILLVLNELSPAPHNALVKAFASRKQEKAKAFALLRQFWRLSTELLLMFEVLQTLWSLPEGATMQEILTPERVMAIGEEWMQIFLRNLSPEQLNAYLDPAYKQTLLSAGREEGREEALCHTIEQILGRRLGNLPPVVSERLEACTLAQLNTLVNPALDAATWDEFVAALPPQPQ